MSEENDGSRLFLLSQMEEGEEEGTDLKTAAIAAASTFGALAALGYMAKRKEASRTDTD